MPSKTAEPVQIYQLKVILRGAHKPIWRQLQVKSDITLAKLHRILQTVMGWTNTHLHRFLIRGAQYEMPDEGDVVLRKMIDGRKQQAQRCRLGSSLAVYLRVRFRRRVAARAPRRRHSFPGGRVRYPVCLAGARACPPEDVGGALGYQSLLEAIHNLNHPQHDEYLEWIGDGFRPRGVPRGRGQSETAPAEVIRANRPNPLRPLTPVLF